MRPCDRTTSSLTSQELAARIGWWLRRGEAVDVAALSGKCAKGQIAYVLRQLRMVLPMARRNGRLAYAPHFRRPEVPWKPTPIQAGGLAGWAIAEQGEITIRELSEITGLSLARCGGLLSGLLSQMLPLERRDEWRQLERGKARVAVYYVMELGESA